MPDILDIPDIGESKQLPESGWCERRIELTADTAGNRQGRQRVRQTADTKHPGQQIPRTADTARIIVHSIGIAGFSGGFNENNGSRPEIYAYICPGSTSLGARKQVERSTNE